MLVSEKKWKWSRDRNVVHPQQVNRAASPAAQSGCSPRWSRGTLDSCSSQGGATSSGDGQGWKCSGKFKKMDDVLTELEAVGLPLVDTLLLTCDGWLHAMHQNSTEKKTSGRIIYMMALRKRTKGYVKLSQYQWANVSKLSKLSGITFLPPWGKWQDSGKIWDLF